MKRDAAKKKKGLVDGEGTVYAVQLWQKSHGKEDTTGDPQRRDKGRGNLRLHEKKIQEREKVQKLKIGRGMCKNWDA